MNTKVETMTYFVLSGSAVFHFKGEDSYKTEEGDCVFIGRNKKYRVEIPEGKTLTVLMASNPAWNPDQYIIE